MPTSTHPPILENADLLARFNALDAFLGEHAELWRPRPFVHYPALPWEAQHPQLAAWLRAQSLEHAEAAHNQPHLLPAPAPFPQLATQAYALSLIGELPQRPALSIPAQFKTDVPGRKWQQIDAFARSLNFSQTPQHWLDWCAGKGHLGRRLAHDGGALTCLEYNPQLVRSGEKISSKLGIHAQHIAQDVLADNAAAQLHAQHTPVALHACGDLHVRLLQLASQTGCQQLAVAPCCYNRISGSHYQALSKSAQGSTLQLSIDDLGLPLSETVTAGARVRRQRDLSMARRLAFDGLQRHIRGIDEYLPTPSLPAAWLDKPFADYCKDLAALKQLPPPARKTGKNLSNRDGNAWLTCATWSYYAAYFAAHWNSGCCSTARSTCKNRAMRCVWAPSAHPSKAHAICCYWQNATQSYPQHLWITLLTESEQTPRTRAVTRLKALDHFLA